MNPSAYLEPDDVLTDEDVSDIVQARAELHRGEFVRDDEIEWK
jgi:hypothetical protein